MTKIIGDRRDVGVLLISDLKDSISVVERETSRWREWVKGLKTWR